MLHVTKCLAPPIFNTFSQCTKSRLSERRAEYNSSCPERERFRWRQNRDWVSGLAIISQLTLSDKERPERPMSQQPRASPWGPSAWIWRPVRATAWTQQREKLKLLPLQGASLLHSLTRGHILCYWQRYQGSGERAQEVRGGKESSSERNIW